ncbi:DsbA family protein [Undibacterium pigrum]|uniref:2-hydroxychromene-2-carboxylate isomerase n=1 Tax=Undibacterium pigrum TaxID=401470 RepID=A0A318IVG2_9BURK|nr:DsbA family protein [Undibacterium pigrum]PXX40176.1 2-hydroxychromene-2-carboxylate isomerase [Undibacterium pigrum]
MSIKTLLMPVITQHMLGRSRLLKLRERALRARLRSGAARQLHYFHQADDPYSVLAAHSLAGLQQKYQLQILPYIVSPPDQAAAPEREKLQAYSRHDAGLLAQHYALPCPDFAQQAAPEKTALANRLLVSAIHNGQFINVVDSISTALWTATQALTEQTANAHDMVPATAELTLAEMQHADEFRKQQGHYLGACFLYEGEWYWGIDRLYHLEQRLQNEMGIAQDYMYPPPADLNQPLDIATPPEIDFFFSLRSPYSAIVAERVFRLGQLTGAKVNLRYLLPMVMRGLPVPADKRSYIALDAAREAHVRHIPFGRLNDPVGRPTERGLAVMPLAERLGCGQAYVLSFMRGVWAEGVDAGSDSGLRKITDRAGLPWDAVRLALQDQAWRATAEANRHAMATLGLWGVPSFSCAGTAVWGQDRLWVIADIMKKMAASEEQLPLESQTC